MPSLHAAVSFAITLGAAAPCGADALHVYGPEGTPSARRALVVVERADGRCASWDDLIVGSPDEGVELTLGERVGPCARWIEIATSPPRAVARLQASSGGAVQASAAVAMGSELGLEVRVQRRGTNLVAQVAGAPDDEPVRVVATWSDGERELIRHEDGWRGSVPSDALVGVIARSGGLTGAAASPASRQRGPAAVILTSELGVPVGGSPRMAAFVVVTDARGRLSRNVPLRIHSERGRLRSLRWLEPGLAAVRLAVDHAVGFIDLAVEVGGIRAAREISVAAGWPASADLDLPDEVEAGAPFDVRVTVRSPEGEALDGARVIVRCGAEPIGGRDGAPPTGGVRARSESRGAEPPRLIAATTGAARCVAPTDRDALDVVIAVAIDGRFVPVAGRVVTVRPVAPPPVAPVVRAPDPTAAVVRAPPPPPPPDEDTWALAAGAWGGLDVWARGSVGAVARLGARVAGPLYLGGSLRYGATFYRATSEDPRVATVGGVRHATELLAEASLRAQLEGLGLVGWLGAGLAWIADVGAVGDGGFQEATFTPLLSGGAGPSIQIADELAIDTAIGVRVPLAAIWNEAAARFFAEVSLVWLG